MIKALKTQYSTKYFIWKNIEKFVARYNNCLLDNLMCIIDEGSQDPLVRYKDFTGTFTRHFGLLSRSAVRHEDLYPRVSVYFGDTTKTRWFGCREKLDVYFHIVKTTSPGGCNVNNCSACSTLNDEEWAECVAESIIGMFKFKDEEIVGAGKVGHITNLFYYLNCKTGLLNDANLKWNWNIEAEVDGEPFTSELTPRDDESLEFFVKIPLRVISKYKDCDNCEEMSPCCS